MYIAILLHNATSSGIRAFLWSRGSFPEVDLSTIVPPSTEPSYVLDWAFRKPIIHHRSTVDRSFLCSRQGLFTTRLRQLHQLRYDNLICFPTTTLILLARIFNNILSATSKPRLWFIATLSITTSSLSQHWFHDCNLNQDVRQRIKPPTHDQERFATTATIVVLDRRVQNLSWQLLGEQNNNHVPFFLSRYKDKALCEIVDMGTCDKLLGRP